MKHLFIFLSILLATTCLRAETTEINGLYYNLDKDNLTAELTHYPKYHNKKANPHYKGAIAVPVSVESAGITYTVTTIGCRAFYLCTELTAITVPNSVTSIGAEAFFGCAFLSTITLSNSVATIGKDAFTGCYRIREIKVPNRSLARFRAMEGLIGRNMAGYYDGTDQQTVSANQLYAVGMSSKATISSPEQAAAPAANATAASVSYVTEVEITTPFEAIAMSSVLAAYNNEFAEYEMPERDDSFPYALFRVRLSGNRNLVRVAKQTLQLSLGQAFQTEKMITSYDNQILYLVPRSARTIYITCGDGCQQQLIYSGRLESNRIYEGMVEVK